MPQPVCKIDYDNNFSTYYAGQVLKGSVVLNLLSPKKFRSIKIKFLGAANVKWDETRSTTDSSGGGSSSTRTTFHSTQEFFKVKQFLQGDDYSQGCELPPGKYRYPFSLALPSQIPSSFEGRHGNIRYTIRVIVDRPWRFNHEYKFAFTVLDPLNLNHFPQLGVCKDVGSSKRFGLFSSKACIMNIQLPCTGFVPGQDIPIVIHCNNESQKTIEYVSVKLIRNDEYHAKKPYKKTSKFKQTEVKFKSRAIPAGKDYTLEPKITIPPVVACGLRYCSIINTSFHLKITAEVSGLFTRSLCIEIPVTIGTIPFFNNSIKNDPEPTTSDLPPAYSSIWNDLPTSIPPPTYEESQNTVCSLRDKEDNKYLNIQDSYTPKYPVFHFSSHYKPSK